MSKAINALRGHFNGKKVPNGSKFLTEERDRINAMVDDVERENAKLRKAVSYLYDYAKHCGITEDDLREIGIEVNE